MLKEKIITVCMFAISTLSTIPAYLKSIPLWVSILAICFTVVFFFIASVLLFHPLKAKDLLNIICKAGRGGNTKSIGNYSRAEGGAGGEGGIGIGGDGGDAESIGDHSSARGGDGGNSAQWDGRGGRRTMSQGERLNMETFTWSIGYGGAGANAPEYDRRLNILIKIRERYFREFPNDKIFIDAGIDLVPAKWTNKCLEELGETWRITLANNFGYVMPPLNPILKKHQQKQYNSINSEKKVKEQMGQVFQRK